MEEAGYQLRVAVPADVDKIRRDVRFTLANPEGKAQRKRYLDAIERDEILVLAHHDPREQVDEVAGFLEWHTKVDRTMTIRDAGSTGEEPHAGTLRRLIRELLSMYDPPIASVKVREDLTQWNAIFQQVPGFTIIGREYSRPHWRNLWEWTPESERAATRLSPVRRRRP